MEPRISGDKADKVIQKIGLDGAVKVEASGFSGGIWCFWKRNCIKISVVLTSRYCIHFRVNPNSVSSWFLSVIYASPQSGAREHLWEELHGIKSSCSGPWAIAGDFNTVLYGFEKDGGEPPYHLTLPLLIVWTFTI